jgi:flagellar biosynthesis protein FliP
MLPAVLAVIAALAFVLGLGALCLWGLKRWGKLSMSSRSRIAVEVVQRIPLGPKTGLAVVRVGEKVMAVSVGDGGIRTLFELDEADRQRVIASSDVPTPMESSREASAAFAKFLPGAFGRAMSSAVSTSMAKETEGATTPAPFYSPAATSRNASAASAVPSAIRSPAPAAAPHATMVFNPNEAREIPSFLTAPLSRAVRPNAAPVQSLTAPTPTRSAPTDRDFRAILGGAMSGATRLAVFTGAMVLASAVAMPVFAQAAPPTSPPAAPSAATTGATTGATPLASVVSPAAAAATPQTLPLPALPTGSATPSAAPNGVVDRAVQPITPAVQQIGTPTTRPATPDISQPPVAPKAPLIPPASRAGRSTSTSTQLPPRTGNGASVNQAGTAARRPTSQMQLDSAAPTPPNSRASAAQPAPIAADEAVMRMLPQMDVQLGDQKEGGLRLNGTVGIVVMMGLLTLLPTLLLMMTGFTRILIVLHFLKQAMGTQSAPPAQLLAAMALLLTGFVMAPTLTQVNNQAITPWLDGKITQVEMMKTSVVPMREFMLKQTRESDLKTFVEMSKLPRPNTAADVPLHVLMAAFVASELRTAFQIGFAIYLPFIIIDTVVASVLMSMGMFMLPPAMISLPFKLLLFVLVDGWSLTISSLVQSFK